MSFNIDTVIFFVFLAANLYFGLKFSIGVKTIKQYAIGDGNFNSYTVAGTLIATWVCGEFFYTLVTETYKEGLFYIIAALSNVMCFVVIGWLFVPRMSQFLGKTSIAEAMGELYGTEVRILTAIAGFIAVTGVIAAQLKIAGFLFEYVLNIPYYYFLLIIRRY
jgi:Na+/proline symporter